MKWVNTDHRIPIKSWCTTVEANAMEQAINLANHPKTFGHVGLMPDCHLGYGMPIGGVVALEDAISPNMVGVDIGCGMMAIKTNLLAQGLDKAKIRAILERIKKAVPVGFRRHKEKQLWQNFSENEAWLLNREWNSVKTWTIAQESLGTLGGGNHFIEIQQDDKGFVWLMIHSGSRNLGTVIAEYYHKMALELNKQQGLELPHDDLAFLPIDTDTGITYLNDMWFALDFAQENRHRIMERTKEAVDKLCLNVIFQGEINIHHNYAALEHHFGKDVWVHRKGATSASDGKLGIIPGSMGTPSYIVCGRGNHESFKSCSHGAGRAMGRMAASRTLDKDQCDAAMDGIVCDRWNKITRGKMKGKHDLGEAPGAYKDIDQVIEAQSDLVDVIHRLRPLGVVKG